MISTVEVGEEFTENCLDVLISLSFLSPSNHGALLTNFGASISQTSRSSDPCGYSDLEAYLFSVVDLPLDGFPTRPIKGSRGMLSQKYIHSHQKNNRGSLKRYVGIGVDQGQQVIQVTKEQVVCDIGNFRWTSTLPGGIRRVVLSRTRHDARNGKAIRYTAT